MPFSVQENYNAVVIEITGKFLGSLEGAAFKKTVSDLKDAGKKRVVVDLSKTDLMDSSGIGTLIAALTTMRNAGGDIYLAGVEKRMRNLFLMTRLLGNVFEDYDTVEDAVNAFENPA